jgi:hypothetical protein
MGEAKRRLMPPLKPWTPFERVSLKIGTFAEELPGLRQMGFTYEKARDAYEQLMKDEVWVNSRYQVNVRRGDAPETGKSMTWLSIKRLDKAPIGPERFRDFQRIKNELVGPENEGIELYPAESRLVDTSNQYHIWVMNDPTFRFPLGWNDRLVVAESIGGAVQQPFEDDLTDEGKR